MKEKSTKTRIVVLISGNGSNLQAIMDAIRSGILIAEVSAVISNKRDAYGLERARKVCLPAVVLPKLPEQSREEYDAQLARVVLRYAPDWVVLAGWMRILSMQFLSHFTNHVINLHPALPGSFPGTHAIERAYEAFQRGEIQKTGVMVHLVQDEGVDIGPVLSLAQVPIHPDDTLADLEKRIHQMEHHLLVDTLVQLISKEK